MEKELYTPEEVYELTMKDIKAIYGKKDAPTPAMHKTCTNKNNHELRELNEFNFTTTDYAN